MCVISLAEQAGVMIQSYKQQKMLEKHQAAICCPEYTFFPLVSHSFSCPSFPVGHH